MDGIGLIQIIRMIKNNQNVDLKLSNYEFIDLHYYYD